MKRIYQKPEMKVVLLQHKTNLLVSSPYDATPPNEIPDYDDWFGSRQHDGVWGDGEEE